MAARFGSLDDFNCNCTEPQVHPERCRIHQNAVRFAGDAGAQGHPRRRIIGCSDHIRAELVELMELARGSGHLRTLIGLGEGALQLTAAKPPQLSAGQSGRRKLSKPAWTTAL